MINNYVLMILLKRFQNSLFFNNLFFRRISLNTSSQTKNYNPLATMAIEKVLAFSYGKKCNSAEDAKLYALVFQAFSKSNNTSEKIKISIDKQAQRLMTNLFNSLPDLPLKQTILVANHILQSFYFKKVTISQDLFDKFFKQVNKKIFQFLRSESDEKIIKDIIQYFKKIIFIKKQLAYLKQILQLLITNTKTDNQIAQLLRLFVSMKYKNPMMVQLLLKQILEDRVGARIQQIPLSSPLIDQVALRIFIQFNMHIKRPYNYLPPWMMVLTQKIIQKYMNPQYGVTTLAKVTFLKIYLKLFKEIMPITSASLITSKHMEKLVVFFHYVCQQVLDYLDNQDFSHYLYNFIFCVGLYRDFVSKNPNYETLDHLSMLEDIYQRIFTRYLYDISFQYIQQQKQQQICYMLTNYTYNLLQVNQQKGKTVSKKLILSVYGKLSQLFIQLSTKYQKNYQKYYQIFLLLEPLALLHQQLTTKYTNILTGSKIEHNKKSVANQINKILYKFDDKTVIQYYRLKKDKSSSSKLFDFIGTCYLYMLFVNEPISEKLQKLFETVKTHNLTVVIQNFSDSPLIAKPNTEWQLTKLSQKFKNKIENYFAQQQNGNQSQSSILQISQTKYHFKSIEDQLSNNFLSLFKNGSLSKLPIICSQYQFWFLQNSQIVQQMFSKKSAISINGWFTLISIGRYLTKSVSSSAIDTMSEIFRVSIANAKNNYQFQLTIKRCQEIFIDKNIQQILRKKVDDFADLKFCFMTALIVQNNLQQPRKQKKKKVFDNKKNYKRLREQQNEVKDQGQEGSANLSLKLNIQLINLCCMQLDKPLEFNNFKSKFISQIVNDCIEKLYEGTDSMKLHTNTQKIMRKPRIFSNNPIQKILYLLSLHNSFGSIEAGHGKQGSKYKWTGWICLHTLLQNLKQKYSPLSIYNILLGFNMAEPQNKNAHDSFLSQQLQQQHQKNIQRQQNKMKIQLQCTVYKYYYYLLAANRSKQIIDRHAELLWAHTIMSDEEVANYWLNKNIVIKTSEQSLVHVMLSRLLSSKYKLTYMQYCTILNAIITLKQAGRLKNYLYSQSNRAGLESWVHGYFGQLICQQKEGFVQDYFTIRTYFGPNKSMQQQLTTIIDRHLQSNNLYLIQTLYLQGHRLSSSSTQCLKQMLSRAWKRCLLKDYYKMRYSSEFRVQLILLRTWGLVLYQNSTQLLRWFNDVMIKEMDIANIEQYLMKQEHRAQKQGIIIRYRILQNMLKQYDSNSGMHQVLERVCRQEQQRMQVWMSMDQQILASTLNLAQNMTKIGQSKMQLIKEQNTYTYLCRQAHPPIQQHLQLQYIKSYTQQQQQQFNIRIILQ